MAAAIEREGRFLVARRTKPDWAAGRWEFPGGKVERGETEEQALIREIAEELGVVIAVGDRVPGEWPLPVAGPSAPAGPAQQGSASELMLHLYLATIVSGEPKALDHHDQLRWVTREQFDEVDWLESDREAVRSLRDRPDC